MRKTVRMLCDECGETFEREARKMSATRQHVFCSHKCKNKYFIKTTTSTRQFVSKSGKVLSYEYSSYLVPFRRGESMAVWQFADYMDITIPYAMLVVKRLVRQKKLQVDKIATASSPVPVYRLGKMGFDTAAKEFALSHIPEIWEPIFNMCKSNNVYNQQV